MIDHGGAVYANSEIGLLWLIIPGAVSDENNNMTECRGAVYTKNYIKLSWSIKLGVICHENQIGQQSDQSYRCGLS